MSVKIFKGNTQMRYFNARGLAVRMIDHTFNGLLADIETAAAVFRSMRRWRKSVMETTLAVDFRTRHDKKTVSTSNVGHNSLVYTYKANAERA